MTLANHLAEDAMKGRQAAVLAVLCLVLALVSFGCGPKDYPPELLQAKSALADSKAEGASENCPDEYASAEAMLQKAEILWEEDEDTEMKVVAAEAEKLALGARECTIAKASTMSTTGTAPGMAIPKELGEFSESIYFGFNENAIGREDAEKLRATAELIKSFQEETRFWVLLSAYTDNVGKTADNIEISRRRGVVVRYFLIDQGVLPENLLIRPLGVNSVTAMSSTADGSVAIPVKNKKKKLDPEMRKVVITIVPLGDIAGHRVGDPYMSEGSLVRKKK